eukprot:superscaffoldBa00002550_g14620
MCSHQKSMGPEKNHQRCADQCDLGNNAITGKVVQKSALRSYQTQQKEKKVFFYLGVSDEISCIKVMVYGAHRYQDIQEGRCYLIRNVSSPCEGFMVYHAQNHVFGHSAQKEILLTTVIGYYGVYSSRGIFKEKTCTELTLQQIIGEVEQSFNHGSVGVRGTRLRNQSIPQSLIALAEHYIQRVIDEAHRRIVHQVFRRNLGAGIRGENEECNQTEHFVRRSNRGSRGEYYSRPKDLLEQLVPVVKKYDTSFDATFNNMTKCLDIKGNGRYKIRAYPPLVYTLGLKVNEWWTLSGRSTPYRCDLNTEMDRSNIPVDTAVALIDYPLNTIFSQCEVMLGDRLISQSSTTHPNRAMIETLLNYSEDTLKSQFSACLFYKDIAGAMDSIVTNNSPNKGLVQRAVFTDESKEVDLLGLFHRDIFFSERLLLKYAFCLMGTRASEFVLKPPPCMSE